MTPVLLVAMYAAIVATLALVVAYKAYRTSRRAQTPNLVPTSRLRPSDGESVAELRITVRNQGGATGEIIAIELNLPGPHSIPLGKDRLALHGPELPQQILPNSARTWTVEANSIIHEMNKHGWPNQARAVVLTGGLTREWEDIRQYTTFS